MVNGSNERRAHGSLDRRSHSPGSAGAPARTTAQAALFRDGIRASHSMRARTPALPAMTAHDLSAIVLEFGLFILQLW